MMRVLIADDHGIVRRGLRNLLEDEADLRVAGEAADALELFELLRKHSFDALVLDISMPGRDGLDSLKEIKQLYPDLPVLVLTMHAEEQFGIRAVRAGASGYLTKDRAPTELVQAIRLIVKGRHYIGPSLVEKMADELARPRHDDRPLHEILSDREFQVLQMLAAGKTASRVANELSLSVKTISTYRTRVLEKLRLTNTAELIRYAVNHGIVS